MRISSTISLEAPNQYICIMRSRRTSFEGRGTSRHVDDFSLRMSGTERERRGTSANVSNGGKDELPGLEQLLSED